MRRFLRRIGEGGGPQQVIDPASLPNLELYLRSDTIAPQADGSTMNGVVWADQSGHGRDCAANAAVLYRTGANASPRGKGLVGIDEPLFVSPGPELQQSAGTLTFPVTRGVMLYIWYLRTATTTIDGQQANIFNQGVNPGILVADAGGNLFSGDPGHPHMIWSTQAAGADLGRTVFPGTYVFDIQLPPGGTGGNARQNGAAIGPVINWLTAFAGNPYFIGQSANAQFTSSIRVGAIALFSDSHSIGTRIGVEAFFSALWG